MRLIDADALLDQYGLKDATKYGNKNTEQQHNSYSTLMMYEIADMIYDAPTITDWTPCADRLPENERKGIWEEYEVTVCESHYPTSSYDPCDAPYSKEIVTTALFDDEQKIWHICRSKEAINALLKEEDFPLNGDVIIAWRDMPNPYNPDYNANGKVQRNSEQES